MNYRFVIQQLSLVLLVLSTAMAVITAWVALTWTAGNRPEMIALFVTIGVGALLGTGGFLYGRGDESPTLGRREAMLVVAMSWLVGAAFAGLPYFIWANLAHLPQGHAFHGFADCYFEAMSGLTTTGATVLADVDSIPRALLLWRATTHWLGGLGIVVLFVAVLPTIGVGGKRLFQVEAPGPKQQGVRPRIRETARVLWFIYLGLTLVEIVLLRIAGMEWFDAICHTFATLATGGFSTHNASVGYYDSWAIDTIVIVFMILAGVNFGLYFHLARRRWRTVWKDPEVRLYLGVLAVAAGLVTLLITGRTIAWTSAALGTIHADLPIALRAAAFQVASVQTTTGFGTADFDGWPFLAKAILVALMFIGGCAGSTAGGIKVIRVWVALKVIVAEVERVFRPSVVRTIRVGSGVVTSEMRQSVLVYVVSILLLFLAGAMALMILEPTDTLTFETAATAAAATLNNIGPGLARVGPVENYGFFSPASKLVMSLLMVLGRLELYAIFVLLLPSFWRTR